MAGKDLEYGLEMLAKAVARGADGIAATDDGGPQVRRRIVRALEVLEAEGLVVIIRTRIGIMGAELTQEGHARGKEIAARSAPPVRLPGDVLDVLVVRSDGGAGGSGSY